MVDLEKEIEMNKTNAEILNDNSKSITMKESNATLNMLSFINKVLESKTASFESKKDVSQLLVNYIGAVRDLGI